MDQGAGQPRGVRAAQGLCDSQWLEHEPGRQKLDPPVAGLGTPKDPGPDHKPKIPDPVASQVGNTTKGVTSSPLKPTTTDR